MLVGLFITGDSSATLVEADEMGQPSSRNWDTCNSNLHDYHSDKTDQFLS